MRLAKDTEKQIALSQQPIVVLEDISALGELGDGRSLKFSSTIRNAGKGTAFDVDVGTFYDVCPYPQRNRNIPTPTPTPKPAPYFGEIFARIRMEQGIDEQGPFIPAMDAGTMRSHPFQLFPLAEEDVEDIKKRKKALCISVDILYRDSSGVYQRPSFCMAYRSTFYGHLGFTGCPSDEERFGDETPSSSATPAESLTETPR